MAPLKPVRNARKRSLASMALGAFFGLLLLGYVAAPVALALSDKPALAIPIPNLKLSTVEVANKDADKTAQQYLGVPWIAEYVSGVYNYVSGAAILVGGVMFIVGGFQYVTAGADAARVTAAKQRITDAAIGMLIAIGSYVILVSISENLVSLSGIKVKRVQDAGIAFALKEAGMKNADAAEETELGAGKTPSGGKAPAVAPQSGENVSIADINLAGAKTAYETIRRFCATPGSAGDDYDAKIQNLVRAILGFHQACITDKKCAYFRGGFANLAAGTITATQLDAPYGYKTITGKGVEIPWGPDCDAYYQKHVANWYKGPAPGTYTNLATFKEQAAKLKADQARLLPGGDCYKVLIETYKEKFAKKFEAAGIYGGDCGTTLVSMYNCAGGKVATGNAGSYTSGQRAGQGGGGPDSVAFKAMNEGDLLAQIEKKGGLKFGDLVNIGQQNWQHNFIYTGGREDVPFEVFEMGSSGADGLGGVQAKIPGLGSIGGMYAWPKKGQAGVAFIEYVRMVERSKKAAGKSIYPIYIWRPYEYKKCESKSECDDGQACHCTASDSAAKFPANKCSMYQVCHKVKPGTYCLDEEDCAKGQKCDLKGKSGFCI